MVIFFFGGVRIFESDNRNIWDGERYILDGTVDLAATVLEVHYQHPTNFHGFHFTGGMHAFQD
jgi:hypothetical protein